MIQVIDDIATLPILVVDDEEVVRRFLRVALESEGYRVEEAVCAEDGLARTEHDDFLMVITDVQMPGMSGLEMQRKLRESAPHLPVVVMTAYPTIERAIEAVRLGAVNFIAKPFGVTAVLHGVERAVTARRALRRNLDTLRLAHTEVRLKIPSTPEHVSGALHFITERTPLADLYPPDVVFQVRLAVDEALSNAFEHGNAEDPSKQIAVDVEVDAQQFRISIEDEGPGFDPGQVADPLDPANLEKLLDGGRGVFLMRCHMDGVEFNGRGNRVYMWRNRPVPEQPSAA